MSKFCTKYMSAEINTEEISVDDNYKGYLAFSLIDYELEDGKFFFECFESAILQRCKTLFPKGNPRSEEWAFLMEIVDDTDITKMLDLIRFVRDLEAQFLQKTRDAVNE